jgi:two-component system, OmpR family, phosphate regulon sensor histidine kinase PhoR
MSLASRVTLVLVVVAGALAVLLSIVAIGLADRAVEDRALERLRREIDLLADEIAPRLQNPDSLDGLVRRASTRLGVRVTVISPDGHVVNDSTVTQTGIPAVENQSSRPEVIAARAGDYGTSIGDAAAGETDFLYLARRIDPTNRNSPVLRIAVPLSELRPVDAAHAWILGAVVTAASALLVVVGSVAVSRLARPIGQVTEAALAVARGDLGRDPPESGPAEILELSSALRRMKTSLLESVERVESERRLAAAVFETLPDGVVVVDARLRVLDANGGFRAMMSSPNPGGRPLVDILRDRELFAPFERTLAERAPVDATVRRERDVTWQIAVRPLPPGSRGAAVGILRDVTPLERNEAMRRRFVADVSHELRTPVASIAAAAETLAETEPDDPETPSLVELVRRQAERMRELIEDLTDLSLIESGAVALQRETLNLRVLACETAEEFRAAARARDVSIHVEAEDDVAVEGDRRRIGQILRNLLDNAVKFSPPGGTVTVRVELSGDRPAVVVEDEGPGIAPQEQDRIFQRFYQVDRSRSKARPGTGLGLAIVKHLAHLHGADVTVRSQPGRGSAFRVTFPGTRTEAVIEAGGKRT